jgi:CheY-like chemotaxis protein
MIGVMLANMGYEVSLAADGNSAVTQFKQALLAGSPHDAVILDLTIPGGIGGKEVIKILSRLAPNLKAIVSSGYSDDPVVANYREYGFVASLSKPYDMEALKKRLEQVFATET